MRTRPYPFLTADNSNGPYRGRLYLTYAKNTPDGSGNKPDINLRYSTDFGTTWSARSSRTMIQVHRATTTGFRQAGATLKPVTFTLNGSIPETAPQATVAWFTEHFRQTVVHHSSRTSRFQTRNSESIVPPVTAERPRI